MRHSSPRFTLTWVHRIAILASLAHLPTGAAQAQAPAQTKGSCSGLYKTVEMDAKYLGENHQGVKYFTPSKLAKSQLVIKNGLLNDLQGQPIHGGGIWVMDQEGVFYFTQEHEIGKIHHSSFFSGQPVAAAGTFGSAHGRLLLLTDQSGHYLPKKSHIVQAIAVLQKQGVSFEDVSVLCTESETVRRLKTYGITAGVVAVPIGGAAYFNHREEEREETDQKKPGSPSPASISEWLTDHSGKMTDDQKSLLTQKWVNRNLTWAQFIDIKQYQRTLKFYLSPEEALLRAEKYVLDLQFSSEKSPEKFEAIMKRFEVIRKSANLPHETALDRAENEVLPPGNR